MALGDYADENYLGDPAAGKAPTGPLAVAQVYRDENGVLRTAYIDARTGQPVTNLKGYTVQDGDVYYDPSDAQDTNKDGTVDPEETAVGAGAVAKNEGGHTTREDALGHTPGPKGTASNNFGYKEKPGFLGPLGMAAGLVNPGVGAAIGMASKAYNVGNMSAVDAARKGLGLSGLSMGQQAKGALKDNKGQIGNVSIGDNKYSVGFGALSPDGKTNLTYNEAKQRANVLGKTITETPKDEVSAPPKDGKSLKSRVEKVTGLERGWLSKALTDLTGIGKVTPETAAKMPEAVAKATPTPAPSKEASVGLPSFDSVKNSPSTAVSTDTGVGYGKGTIGTTGQQQAKPGTTVAGVGLMSGLSPSQGRPNMPGSALTGKIQEAVSKTFGPGYSVSVTSGTETAGMAQVGSSRHKTGLAADIDVVDPSGKRVTDVNALNDMAAQFAKDNPQAGIGFGKGYMVDGRMHLDITGQGKQWGAANTVRNMDPALSQTIDAARLGYNPTPFSNAPTPSPNPGPSTGFTSQDEKSNTGSVSNARSSFVSQDERASMPDRMGIASPAPAKNEFDKIGPTAQNAVRSAPAVGANTTKMANTPAGLAAMGFSNYSAAQKAEMAKAIAGELGPKSLAALSGKDPVAKATAMAEVGSMVAGMVNRDASTLGKTTQSWSKPSQVNSLMPSNMATTVANAKNPAVLGAVNNFFSGAIPGANYKATNWVNLDEANPGWAAKTKDPTKIGMHTFSTDPAFSPDAANKAALGAFGTMAGTGFSPGKTKDDRVGFAGPSNPSTYGGAGYTPGGMNSPSGSGVSTGLGTRDKNTPGYGGPGLGYGGLGGGALGPSGNNAGLGGPASNNSGNKSESSSSGSSSRGGSDRGGAGTGTSAGGSAGMSGGGGYSPGGMGSPSGSSASSGSKGSSSSSSGSSGGGLGKNSDGSSNGWGGRSGSV